MRNLFLILSFVVALTACNPKNSSEYSINGLIEGKFTGDVYLQKNVDGKFQILDTATVQNGVFAFEGEIENPDLYYIGIDESRFVGFFNEAAKINIKFHIDSLNSPEVEGSVSDDEYRAYLKRMDDHQSAQIGIYSEYNEATRKKDSATIKGLEVKMDELDRKHDEEIRNFISQNPSSFVSPYIAMRNSYKMDLTELKEVLNGFDTKVKTSSFSNMLRDRIKILEEVSIGKKAPDFTMNDPQGNPVTLSDMQGSVVLIDFWASWCGPCRRENPNVVSAYNKYNSQGFDIIGVSLDRDASSWEKAISDDKLTWKHVSDLQYWNNAVSKKYGIISIPSNLLINKEGIIIAKDLTGEDLIKKLDEVFAPV